MNAFDAKNLGKRLARLDSKRQLAFGAAVCEGMIPTYAHFESREGWGNLPALHEALRIAWRFALGESITDTNLISSLNEKCERAAPGAEEFESLDSSAAQDACLAICALLDYIISQSKERIIQIARYAIDSIDLYVQEIESMHPSDPDLERKILNHLLMQRELMRQEKLLKFLEEPRRLDEVASLDLKKIAGIDGNGNLAA